MDKLWCLWTNYGFSLLAIRSLSEPGVAQAKIGVIDYTLTATNIPLPVPNYTSTVILAKVTDFKVEERVTIMIFNSNSFSVYYVCFTFTVT